MTRPIFQCRLCLVPRQPKSRSEREPTHEASGPSPAEPMVRILFPLQRLGRTVIDGIRPRKLGSHWTLCWREMDSNFRFRTREATDLSFRFLSVYVPETVRVLAQRSTLLGAGGSKSRVPPTASYACDFVPFSVPKSAYYRPECLWNAIFRDGFAGDCPLQRRVRCEPVSRGNSPF